jgi:hypothetical protein
LTAKVLLFRRNAKQPQALRKKKNPPQLLVRKQSSAISIKSSIFFASPRLPEIE